MSFGEVIKQNKEFYSNFFFNFIFIYIIGNKLKKKKKRSHKYILVCSIPVSCTIFYPRFFTIVTIEEGWRQKLYTISVGGHFHPKSNDDCLPCFLYKSFFYDCNPSGPLFMCYCIDENCLYFADIFACAVFEIQCQSGA